MADNIKQLLEGQELSEETKIKVSALVEAKVNEKVQEVTESKDQELTELTESKDQEIATLTESHKAEIVKIQEETESLYESKAEAYAEYVVEETTKKVDAFLTYAVHEWAKENSLAIENGVTNEIFESFMGGVKSLIEQHDCKVPEGADVVESLETELAETKVKLDESIQKTIELSTTVESHEKENVLFSVCEDLTDTQVEKVKVLAEGIDFGSAEEYTTKIETIVETYFKGGDKGDNKPAADINENVEDDQMTSAQRIASQSKSFF